MANLLQICWGIGVLVATGTRWVPDPDLYWRNWLGLASAYFLIMSLGIHPLVIVLVAVNVMRGGSAGRINADLCSPNFGPLDQQYHWFSHVRQQPDVFEAVRCAGVVVWRLAWCGTCPRRC